MPVEYFFDYFDRNQAALLEEFFAFLRFRTISADRTSGSEIRTCTAWLQERLRRMEFDTEIWETSGNPVVYGSWLRAGSDKPTVLIYNHYDVQPVDPLDLWETPPFEPQIRDGKVYARGAEDNKGQCFYVLAALQALFERDGRLPVNVKLCIEGEEEVGSTNFSDVLPSQMEKLKADYLFIVDMGLQKADQPALTLGCRGITGFGFTVEGPNRDLHSGEHGGIVQNPLQVLADILSRLKDSNGKVLVPGFYDDIMPLAEDERKAISLRFDDEEYEKTFGAKPVGGEKAFSPLERAWLRPTLELIGISGGYTGQGSKTIIPARSSAKITCRLVPDQDPDKVRKAVIDRVLELAPEGVRVEINEFFGGGRAVRTSPQGPASRAVADAYEEVLGKSCEYILGGGTIPISALLAQASGARPMFFGYGLPEDNIHSPNECFPLACLRNGAATIGRALELLSLHK